MILIAGGIGAGKSVVSRILRLKGFGVYDCDYRAKILMTGDASLKSELCECAGKDIYDAKGNIERQILADRIYQNENIRKEVDRCVHDAVRKDISSWLSESPLNIFVESAIGAKSRIAESAQEIWLVDADIDTRINRVKKRSGLTTEEIIRIMKAQENEVSIIRRSGKRLRVIENDGKNRMLKILDELIEEFKKNYINL